MSTPRGKARPRALIGLVLGVLACGGAQAALTCSAGADSTLGSFICTESVSFGPASTDFIGAVLTLDKWTPFAAAGFTQTLTGVSWSLLGQATISGTVKNNAVSTQNFALGETVTFGFAPGSGAPAGFLPVVEFVAATATQSYSNITPGATVSFGPFTPSNSGSGSSASLAGFTGPGTFGALVSTSTGLSITGGGNLVVDLSAAASPQVSLTYSFVTSAVPEAPSAALLALGLAGMGLLLRRKP
jgi:hypothetical protein